MVTGALAQNPDTTEGIAVAASGSNASQAFALDPGKVGGARCAVGECKPGGGIKVHAGAIGIYPMAK